MVSGKLNKFNLSRPYKDNDWCSFQATDKAGREIINNIL